jgi:large subunit ribosomal protein L29
VKAHDLREKTDEELANLIADRTDDLMHFRMQRATGVVDNVRGSRNARREIARIKTIQNERARTNKPAKAGSGAVKTAAKKTAVKKTGAKR